MHPAPSVIIFSVFSGMGFGLLAFLGAGIVTPSGLPAFLWWGLGYGLAVVGLLASTFHLGNPQRALLAFTQWRSSWLSREAWASVATRLLLAPVALSDWLGFGWPREIGFLGAALALGTVFTTSMIYTQIKAVPRWHHPVTPLMFMMFSLTGGAILSGQHLLAALLCLALAAVLLTCLPMLGDYFTSDMLSASPKTAMVGNLINDSVQSPGQTGQAGALVMLVLVVAVLPMFYYVRVTSRGDTVS